MSEDAKNEPWPHPLLPWLADVASNTTPLVRFAPADEIEREIVMAAVAHPLLATDAARAQIFTTYQRARVAVMVLALAGGSDLDGEELHALLFVAAQGDPLAFAFCDAAGLAAHIGTLPAFAVATRLPGFINALSDWASHLKYGQPFHGPERLAEVIRDIVEPGLPCADFWQDACRTGYDDQSTFNRALGEAYHKHDDNARKLKNRPPARFKDAIAFGWVPAAMWARRCGSILNMIEPKASDGEKAQDRIRHDIYEVLGFGGSHNGDHDQIITETEAKALESSNNSTA